MVQQNFNGVLNDTTYYLLFTFFLLYVNNFFYFQDPTEYVLLLETNKMFSED